MARTKRKSAYTALQVQVGRRIKWARLLKEPNRAEFARLLGVDRTTVQKIEDGARPPSIFNVMEFAHHLRVTADYILFGSMRGVEGEIAAALAASHPELANPPAIEPDSEDTATAPRTPRKPKKRGRRAA